jgi:VWFA-related protein
MKATALILIILVPIVVAPAVEAQSLNESIHVTLVEVPVRVLDRSGAPIRGLTVDDFVLYDDGKKRTIESFEVIDLAMTPAETQEKPLHPAAYRNFLFLFDLTNSSPGTIERAREAASGFIRTDLGPTDLAAVATFSVEQGVRLLTNFTTDRMLLGAAVETLGNPSYFRITDPLLVSAEVSIPQGSGGAGDRSFVAESIKEQVADANRLAQQGDDAYKRSRLRNQLQQFQNVARVMDRLRGHKQIILLSEGFDARLVQGREDLGSPVSREEMEAALSGEVWKIESDNRFGSSTSSNEIRGMAEIFRRSDVVLHAFDIRGLRTDVDAREGLRRVSNESLFLLSEPTGGEVFKNANDLTSSLQKMLVQQEVIYILGFRAELTGEPGRAHDLRVRTVGIRGARVQHRTGYYEPSSELSPLERALTASEILFHDIPSDQVAVEMIAVPFPAKTGNQVPVILEIDGKKLLEEIQGDTATGDIFIYAFERDGKVAGFLHQQLSLDLTRAAGLLRKAGIRYYGTLVLDSGDYLLRTLVRINENGRSGFRRTALHVPDFSQPTVLQPMLIAEQGDWVMMRGEDRPGLEYPFVIGPRSFIPAILPRLSPDETYELALFTYGVPSEQLRLTASLRSETGVFESAKIEAIGRTPVGDDGSVQYLFRFSSGDLAPGHYHLELKVDPENQTERTVIMPLVMD